MNEQPKKKALSLELSEHELEYIIQASARSDVPIKKPLLKKLAKAAGCDPEKTVEHHKRVREEFEELPPPNFIMG